MRAERRGTGEERGHADGCQAYCISWNREKRPDLTPERPRSSRVSTWAKGPYPAGAGSRSISGATLTSPSQIPLIFMSRGGERRKGRGRGVPPVYTRYAGSTGSARTHTPRVPQTHKAYRAFPALHGCRGPPFPLPFPRFLTLRPPALGNGWRGDNIMLENGWRGDYTGTGRWRIISVSRVDSAARRVWCDAGACDVRCAVSVCGVRCAEGHLESGRSDEARCGCKGRRDRIAWHTRGGRTVWSPIPRTSSCCGLCCILGDHEIGTADLLFPRSSPVYSGPIVA